MIQPFIKVYIGDPTNVELELTNYIESFSFEESLERDNTMELKLSDDYKLQLVEHPAMVRGKLISFQFGFIGGLVSEIFQLHLAQIKVKYGTRINITITAADKGLAIKKVKSNVVYDNITASDIAVKIAGKYNLLCTVSETTELYHGLVQGNRNDFMFLKILAEEQEDDYITYITNNTLFFIKRGLDNPSKILLDIGDNSNILDFEPTWNEVAADGAANSTVAVGVDPSQKKVVEHVAPNDDNESNLDSQSGALFNAGGNYLKTLDVAGNKTLQTEVKQDAGAIVTGATSTLEAKKKSKGRKKKAKMQVLIATLTMVGNPILRADNIITIGTVAREHSGNWYIASIRHEISNSSYISNLHLSKNAVKRKDAGNPVEKGKVNSTVGGNEVNNSKALPQFAIFDGSAQLITVGDQKVVEQTTSKDALRGQ